MPKLCIKQLQITLLLSTSGTPISGRYSECVIFKQQ